MCYVVQRMKSFIIVTDEAWVGVEVEECGWRAYRD